MLWLLGKLSGPPESASRKKLVLAACACARQALRFVPTGEDRPRLAIEIAERWAKNKAGVMLEQVKTAAYAAASAAARIAALKESANIIRKMYRKPLRLK